MKKGLFKVLAIAFSIVVTEINAQSPAIEWHKSYGGSEQDKPNTLEQTSDGGYIIAGHTLSSDGDVTGSVGGQLIWVVKLNSLGSLEWEKTLANGWGGYLTTANSVKQTIDGGYIVVGSIRADGQFSSHSDYYIVKLNSLGNVEWEKQYGGSFDDVASSVYPTSDGGYVVSGASNSSDGDVGGEDAAYYAKTWIIKLTSTGNIVWTNEMHNGATSIIQTTDGGYAIVGGEITKLDNAGNVVWTTSAGLGLNAFQQVSDGYIATGWMDYNAGNHGSYDVTVVKTNTTGDVLWSKSLGGSQDDYAFSIQQTFDGGYVIGGYSESNNGDVTGNHGYYDYLLFKLSSNGNIIWQKSLGGSESDFGRIVRQTVDTGYIMVGMGTSADGDAIGAPLGEDFWIVKLETDTFSAPTLPSAINELLSENSVSFEPNPARTTISISSKEIINGISVFDVNAKEVIKQETLAEKTTLNVQELSAGAYILKVQTKNGLVLKKLIKE